MKSMRLLAVTALATLLSGAALAEEGGFKVGFLSCTLSDSTNLIVYSNEEFTCTYNPNAGENETYSGVITRIGVDLTWKKGQQLLWTVVAPTNNIGPGALAGTYGGVSADVAVGAGVGAKILVGGLEDSIALQPVSLAGNTGVGASAGIESFELKQE